jgi:hypothetical protein
MVETLRHMQARISDWGPETSLETSIGQGRPSPYSVVRAPRVPLLPRVANSAVNGLLTEVIRTSPRRTRIHERRLCAVPWDQDTDGMRTSVSKPVNDRETDAYFAQIHR